jgi:addiction module HigA family antidote
MTKRDAPIHPGEILQEEFLKPAGLTVYRVAKDSGLLLPRVNDIVHGKRAITARTALQLGRYFGTSPEFWMNLQTTYDLDVAKDQAGAAPEPGRSFIDEVNATLQRPRRLLARKYVKANRAGVRPARRRHRSAPKKEPNR